VSFSVDVNVLLYASDRDSRFHHAAVAFLTECAGGGDLFCLTWPTIMGYLRMATHERIFTTPLTPADAAGNMRRLLDLPHVRPLGEDDGFWPAYLEIAERRPLRGNAVPDAHLASILREHGVRTLYTNDVDFKRFDFLDVRNPFDR
jgi:uncharacterized protein